MNNLKLKDGLELSKIILGSVSFGTQITKENSFEIMDYYFENGGNTIDTARAYCGWIKGGEYASEETIGEWVKSRDNRDKIKIITKGAHPSFNEEIQRKRLSEGDIRYDMNTSLNTLKMDYVDLYLLHRDDEDVPVSTIMDTLHQLVLEGKTKSIGVSNWKLKRITEANDYAKKSGKTPLCVSEIQWSLAQCFPKTLNDQSILCMNDLIYKRYLENEFPVIAFTSQAGGVFSNGYQEDLVDIAGKHKKYLTSENKRRYNKLLQLCEEKNYKPSSVAIQYITDNRLPASAIIGCSSVEQLKDSMCATIGKLSLDEIDNLV